MPEGVFGLARARTTYAALIRAARGLLTYWPGTTGPTTTVSNFTLPAQFTLEIWVKWTSVVSNTGLISAWAGSNGAMIWVALDSRIKFHVQSADVDSGVTPTTGVWTHMAVTYDGTTRAIYVNGSLQATGTGVTPVAASTPLITKNYAGNGNPDLSGSVRDAAAYSRALSAGEIAQHYQSGVLASPSF